MRSVFAAFLLGAAVAFGLCTFIILPWFTTLHAQSSPTSGTPPAGNLGTLLQQQPAGTTPGSAAAQMSARDFALAAAIANKFEVIEGQLAIAQASDPALRDFAQMMVKDHTAALEGLKAAARAGGIDLPDDIPPDAIHLAKINAIKNRRGPDFDQAYRIDQVQGHQQAVVLLDTYVQTGGNAALKAWAAKSLVVVRKHQQQLQAIVTAAGSK